MAASIAGRQRDRADAEREISDLTAQIGRVAADIRPPHATLLSGYQNIDRLNETIADRTAQLAAIEQARGHYDHRKLLAGVSVLTCALIGTFAALWWAVLR
jgi:septal ring factor EnvC (AmiA/AmiB activator)